MHDLHDETTFKLVSLLLGKAAAKLYAGDFKLEQVRTSCVSDLRAAYGITAISAKKLVALAELSRRCHAVPLTRGAAFRGSAAVFHHFHTRLRDLKVEQFRVVLIDGKHCFIKDCLISQGTLTTSPVHPREVFRPAIQHAAAAVILVHNHPAGDPSPSSDDLEITRRLSEVGDLVGIRVLDHIIIGDGRYTSLADRGFIR
jgi:DNA repair protein RadC